MWRGTPIATPPIAAAASSQPVSFAGRWGPLSPALSPLRQGKGDSLAVIAGAFVEVRSGIRASSRKMQVPARPQAPLD